ncbi:TadE/TadG family type IV pilus assembly protein [Ruegeria atlantica]|uniref:TadE/TadG family type IV pilus assembly protein n=1 Tax=Ruegeria atlantica TaxID=81569 RepID=UPI00147CEFA6|nr:hypothetical protein [Ruegeria atlantica]
MSLLTNIRQFLGSTARGEKGALSLEAILVLPFFIWTITLAYTYFDGFRQSAANVKAAYTVSDLISREAVGITDTYVASMHLLMQRMANNNSEMRMRISLVKYHEEDEKHTLEWTSDCGFGSSWSNGTVGQLAERLPPMADQNTLIIVETSNDYDPVLKTGWIEDNFTFDNFVFTRPRFVTDLAGPDSSTPCQETLAQTAPLT